MRNPLIKCENCMAYEPSEANQDMGYCHREPIKGHAIQEPQRLDLRINPQVQGRPNYKIVPSFPPTLARLWCMEIKPTPETILKLDEEQKMQQKKAEEMLQEMGRVNKVLNS